MNDFVFWIAFNSFILMMLALDLGVFQKKEKVITLKQSVKWIALWVSIALLFNLVVYLWKGPVKAMEFLTGYLIEMSLSVDNLFVFIVIFAYFRVPKKYEHRVLFWGILAALVLRGIFILSGVALFKTFSWMIYIFGAILIYTGIKMFFHKEDQEHDLSDNFTIRLCRKIFPISMEYDDNRFYTRINNKFFFTPLFLVLMVINITDIVFALDSIPAVLAISNDTFIVYTSNIFAILGLRSIYFALSGMMHLFRFLKFGLAVILTFVGLKMMLSNQYDFKTGWALAIIAGILAISMIASLIFKKKSR
jgi:tellurite resistance protein TerC